jgi:hypothetical protein
MRKDLESMAMHDPQAGPNSDAGPSDQPRAHRILALGGYLIVGGAVLLALSAAITQVVAAPGTGRDVTATLITTSAVLTAATTTAVTILLLHRDAGGEAHELD